MAFVEIRFPDDISYGSSGGPAYSTSIVATDSGYEKRNIRWQDARARYNVAHGVRTRAQLDSLIAFFRARKGRAHGFRFKDWTDYQALGQSLGIGNGSQTVFQLVKHYTSGSVTETRSLAKPVTGTVKPYLNGVLRTSGFTVDTTTGLLTFSTAPAAGVLVSADCEFDVPVRFDSDTLSATLEAYGVESWNNIPLVELRL